MTQSWQQYILLFGKYFTVTLHCGWDCGEGSWYRTDQWQMWPYHHHTGAGCNASLCKWMKVQLSEFDYIKEHLMQQLEIKSWSRLCKAFKHNEISAWPLASYVFKLMASVQFGEYYHHPRRNIPYLKCTLYIMSG